MSERAPSVDGRDAAAILRELAARQPGYTPGWEPQQGTAGAGLLEVVARYAEILIDGLQELPERGQLAFLERLGVGLLPARPARAPLVFSLLPDSPLDVTLPAGSQVAATAATGPIVFITDDDVTLTRARLASLFSLDPGTDEWADHSGRQRDGFTLFGDLEPVEHAVYLGHDQIFALAGAADLTLSFALGPQASASAQRDLSFAWEYLSKDGWLPLEVVEDRTGRLTRSGSLRLRKSCGPDSREETVAGQTSYWVRGRVSRQPISVTVRRLTGQGVIVDTPGHLRAGDEVTADGIDRATVLAVDATTLTLSRVPAGLAEGGQLRQADAPAGLGSAAVGGSVGVPTIDDIRAQVSFTKGSLDPEAAASDGLAVDPASTFHPFGVRPAPFATFFVASKEVFQHRGAEIGVQVTLRQAGDPKGVTLSFEYYDGTTWRSLQGTYELLDGTDRFTQSGEVVFRSPPDWAPVSVNGERNHWLRMRLDSGSYGEPERLTINPQDPTKVVLTARTLKPPVVAQIKLRYSFQTELTALDHCLAYNDFHFNDHSEDARWPRRLFEPFLPVAETQPAVHIGFDRPLPTGLVSLFAAAGGQDLAEAEGTSEFVWEYASPRGWTSLGVLDGTLGFRRGGMIQFVGPRDAVAVDGHNGSLYRLRARLKQGSGVRPAALAGIWGNAVWGTQRQRFEQETLGSSDGSPSQGFRFLRQRVPVLEQERIEVREWAGEGETWRTAVLGGPPEDVSFDRDPLTEAPRAVWVRYAARPHLYRSGPRDRHYTLERATGLLRFGDGRHGMIPPAGGTVRASYSSGGGVAGNLSVGAIDQLRAAVPYVVGVTNVAPAAGGAEAEGVWQVRRRGAQRLRHRDRAISGADVAWLAREASPAVARARCLALAGPDGPHQRGWVTVLIVPDGDEPQPQPTPELLRRVQQHLAARVPATVRSRVRVLGPRYAPVGVIVEAVPILATQAAEVEAALLQRLGRFLHPLRGGPEGAGWEFGQPLHQSQIAVLVEGTDGVDHARRVALRLAGGRVDEIAPVAADELVAAGDHEIKLVVGGDR